MSGKPEEIFTARGMIIKNLKTITTNLDVSTFIWYLLEKVRNVEKLKVGVLELYMTCVCCRRNWTRGGRMLRVIEKGKKRLAKWSDITTLMKAKINSDMLVQRLLNSEQQILFQV